ncbi:SOS response-associated peptidase [Cryobacterium tepidiphilum]|uniref:Abasic site processing protein n=1 Tax=Cryobacterium tepidiphilum TaxID=2486026 RepID=A0A3M8KWH3_9MICO|nr:SOS response-associated peptidase [Cryobacterium tepidiphilum]RNE57009.1 SOS response-associated peptidase [Cryobacterium tepidiphilum]
MCGRFAMDKSTDDLIQEFVAEGGDVRDWRPSYNIAPTDRVPVVRSRERGGTITRTVDSATWGLRPMWAGEKAPAPINARLESVATNGLFRHAFGSNRLIVPMNGYYEWEARPEGKQPHFIQNNSLLAAAGLYEPRKQPDGSWSLTMTIITREAKDASGEIHDRMPVFLTPDTYDQWLRPGQADTENLLAMLDRASLAMAATMHTYPVSKRVNSVRDEEAKHDPALTEPL